MAPDPNKEVARRAYRVLSEKLSSGDLSELDDLVSPDIRDHNPDPGQGPGLEGVKRWFLSLGTAFPDLRVTVEDLIAEGDKVAARVLFRGTHSGDFQGIAATGREVEVQVIDILRIENGRIVERWGLSDQIGLMQQLGALPT